MCHPPFSPVVHPPAILFSFIHPSPCVHAPDPLQGLGTCALHCRFPLWAHAPDPLPGLGTCVVPSLCMHATDPLPGLGTCMASVIDPPLTLPSPNSCTPQTHSWDCHVAMCALPPNPPYVCMPQTHSRDWALAWQVWQTHISHFLPPIRACLRPTPGTGHVYASPPMCARLRPTPGTGHVHASPPLPGKSQQLTKAHNTMTDLGEEFESTLQRAKNA